MELSEQNVLLFPRTMHLGGTENVVIQLCEILIPQVNKVVVCSCGGVNEERLRNMGVKHYLIPDIENKSISNIVQICRDISRIIKKEKTTLIHAHHRMAAFYISFLPAASNCLKIATAHNTFVNKKSLTRLAYKKFLVVACGEKVKQNLCNFIGIPSAQVVVIHNAVKSFDEKKSSYPIIEEYRKQGKFLVANVGRLSAQKGFEYFIDAANEILKKRNDIIFLIIGEGDDRKKLESRSEQYGITDKVVFMGYQTRVQDILHQIDLVVLSSLWEGFPLTPIEAFSVKKTIVATAVDGTVEIVKDGVNGYLVESKNSDILANKILKIIDDDMLKLQFEKEAYEFYCEEFSMDKFTENYLSQYGKLNSLYSVKE